MSFHLNNSNSFFRSPYYLFQESDPTQQEKMPCHILPQNPFLSLSRKPFNLAPRGKGHVSQKFYWDIFHILKWTMCGLQVIHKSVQLSTLTPEFLIIPERNAEPTGAPSPLPSSSGLLETAALLSAYAFAYSGCFIGMESYSMWPLCLTFFTEHKVFKVHPFWNMDHFTPFLEEYNIPVYGLHHLWRTFMLLSLLDYYEECYYEHSYPSFMETQGFNSPGSILSILWMWNFWVMWSTLCLRFLGTAKLVSDSTGFNSTSLSEGSNVLVTSPTLLMLCPFDYSHPKGYEVIAHVTVISISPMANNVEHLFGLLLAICVSSLEKCQFRSFAHFFSCLLLWSFIIVLEIFCVPDLY